VLAPAQRFARETKPFDDMETEAEEYETALGVIADSALV
jgi:hypothetical protein